MSNQDSLFGESNTSGMSGMDRDSSLSRTADEMDNGKDEAQQELEEVSARTDQVVDRAKGVVEDGKQKAGEITRVAQERADEGMNKAADTMDGAAQRLRERGNEHGGTIGSVTGTAADAMESAGQYLHETDTGEMIDQLEAYVRKNPIQSLLIAAGVGFILAKAFK